MRRELRQPVRQFFTLCTDHTILFIETNHPDDRLTSRCVRMPCQYSGSLHRLYPLTLEFNMAIFDRLTQANSVDQAIHESFEL